MQHHLSFTALTRVALIIFCAMGLNISVTYAEEDVTDIAAAEINPNYFQYKENFSVKRLFASRCSWCHQGYGLKQADGPRLSGTTKSKEKVIEQIAYGKSPMPGFRKQLKPWQIEALADYIKALPDVEL
ncbi:MAG: c-type cytochrome [Burkholderiales bacterium]|jgi:cytochrome c2|tara:strand:+ start:422 stop:808 length:387 start_codon:yes stop_codon:yes gene_type:complete